MFIWKIVIRYLGTKRIIRLKGEDNLKVFNKAKEYAKELKEADTEQAMHIDLVSGTRAYGPKKGIHIKRYEMWCPYCIKPRAFVNDQRLGVNKCPVCGISDSDFYVKKYNGIFKKEYEDYLLSFKRKESV